MTAFKWMCPIALAITILTPFTANAYRAYGVATRGVVVIGDSTGTVLYCPSLTVFVGAGKVIPGAACVALDGTPATPAGDVWTVLTSPQFDFYTTNPPHTVLLYDNFHIVDQASGEVMDCAVQVDQRTHVVSGTCLGMGSTQ